MYLFKALDSYSYSLEETVESLNYALSYNPNNAEALFLMAKVLAYQLMDYEGAKHYFEATMTQHMEMGKMYPDYIYTLVRNEDYPEAQRLLDYANKVKGTDRAVIQWLQGQIFEGKLELKPAKKAYKEAIRISKCNNLTSFVKRELERIDDKLPKKKNKKKRKRKLKTKRKEKKKNRSEKK
jgi:tetratricopeptide (TPR) repeat protein